MGVCLSGSSAELAEQGNEHVTISSPEGERYTINGVEQPRGAGTPSAVTYHADSGAEAGRRAHVNPPRAFSYSSTDQRGPVIPSRQYTEREFPPNYVFPRPD